jgi:EAL domain-containing protein (putative c-di-GMP-specific phosphodiesterase class I)
VGYTNNQRGTFAFLVLASTLTVWWMVSVDLADGWIVLYAAALPVIFRLLILASDQAEPTRLLRSAQVWRAMRRGEIVLYYQPKVLIGSDALQSVEALARWEHPRRGTLAPAEWLDATEHRWLSRRFCAYVISQATGQAAAWRAAGHDFPICVNISPTCFSQHSLPRLLARCLDEHELPASYLVVELTEEALELSGDAVAIAEQLTALGVALSLDDFGTGHSSMDRLVGLPLTELKIDKRFVSRMVVNERNQAVVRAAISLGHSLGMTVVAEGVESRETADSLEVAGCDIAQGFLFSRALPAAELDHWMQRAERITRDRAATSV